MGTFMWFSHLVYLSLKNMEMFEFIPLKSELKRNFDDFLVLLNFLDNTPTRLSHTTTRYSRNQQTCKR